MRLPDWEPRLAEYLGGKQAAVFRFGRIDCALFAAGGVQAMTGIDLGAPWRGRYRSANGWRRRLREAGLADLSALVSSHFEEIAPAFARRGDVVMVRGSLGLCTGREAVLVAEPGSVGLVPFLLPEWERAWRVPFPGEAGAG